MNTQFSLSKWISVLLILEVVYMVQSSSLGENVLINGDFSALENPYLLIQHIIPGWTCSNLCEIDQCDFLNQLFTQDNLTLIDCVGQVLDIDSNYTIETATQMVSLNAGSYLLEVTYFNPHISIQGKTMLIYLNQQVIYQITPNLGEESKRNLIYIEVKAKQGNNNLSLTMRNLWGSDGVGFKFKDISFRRIGNSIIEQIFNNSISNPITITFINFPGSRLIFSEIMHFFISLDRLQFYYFHRRPKGYYDNHLLANTNYILNLKGTYLHEKMKTWFEFLNEQEAFVNGLDQRQKYTDRDFLSRSEEGDGFILNNSSVAIFSLPILLLLHLILFLTFLLLSKYPVFRFLRKYSLLATFLLLLNEGNIQQFSFYMFSEFLNLFSISFSFKWVNFLLLLFYFAVLFTACAFFLWAKWHYAKRQHWLCENTKINLAGALCCSVDRGIVCIFSGMFHRILLNSPYQQLIVLCGIEICWLASKIYFMRMKIYRIRSMGIIDILLGFLMVSYQVSCFLYAANQEMRLTINDYVHVGIIFTMICLWILQIMFLMFNQLKELIRYFKISVKIVPNLEEKKELPKIQIFHQKQDILQECYEVKAIPQKQADLISHNRKTNSRIKKTNMGQLKFNSFMRCRYKYTIIRQQTESY